MSTYFKEMLVALAIGAAIFHLAKPIALRFSSASDFSRRRNVWFALTATAFLSPNFWCFVLVAAPLFVWAGRKDTNPVAFYLLLLHVVPAVGVPIPLLGNNGLFPLDNYRLLSLCVLLPTALRLRQSKSGIADSQFGLMDVLLLAYGASQIALYVAPDLPGHVLIPDSFTNLLRRALLFFIDVYVLYYVVSRFCSNRQALVEAQAAFCLACAVMAGIAVFESARHWLLYADLSTSWGASAIAGAYVGRAGSVRAEASAGVPLALGYLLAVAFGFWLYLQTHIASWKSRIAVGVLFWLGLLAAYSRGPWIGAILIYFIFAAIGPRALTNLVKSLFAAAVVAVGIGLSPLGEKIASVLPFFGGSVDLSTSIYRDRLAARSWQLFAAHPFFGDEFVLSKMEDLRQGQGIIDLVNTYAAMAASYGLSALLPFLGFILVGSYRTLRLAYTAARVDPDLALLGASLVACTAGTLLMLWNSSFYLAYEKGFFLLAGFTAAYARFATLPEQRPATAISVG